MLSAIRSAPALSFRRSLPRSKIILHKNIASSILGLSRVSQTSYRRMSTPSTHPSLSLVSTTHAPAAVGPYTQAIRLGDLLFLSGSLGLDPAAGKMVEGGVEAQTEQALKNMKSILEEGGSEVGKVVKTTVFLANMDDFKVVNGIYEKFFGNHKPARSAVQVARLPLNALFEIECIASL